MLKPTHLFALVTMLLLSMNLYGAPKNDDIRILIDVSGSMKKTDPLNLRVSALKLLNGLIPSNSKAGVWTFGRYVNMTVKWSAVDKTWRKNADIGADAIHSNGLYTNIEGALKRAATGWQKADPGIRRNLILLTDGQVDISKDLAKNAASRQAILDRSIKRLRDSGVHVQAIALSKDADEALLRRLALETDGSFEIAESASDLQKIFFKMFERATLPDTISIQSNQFKVDSSIKEMTLLIFRKPGSKSPIIFSPDKTRISVKKKRNSIWRSDEGYNLITIKKPATGVWNIDADIDPDNRLIVVTDLKLEVEGMPAYVMPGQGLNLSTALYNNGKQISKNSFLRFVEFKLQHIDNYKNASEKLLKHAEDRKRKGQYLFDFSGGLEEGSHTVLVTADSQTFNRTKRVDINVQWPVEVRTKLEGEPGNYLFSIKARNEYLKPDSLNPTVFLKSPDGERISLPLENKQGRWVALVETSQDGLYHAEVKLEATSQAGEPISLDVGEFSMVGVYRQPANAVAENAESLKESGLDAESAIDDVTGLTEVESEGDDGWLFNAIIIGVSNLIIVLIGIGIFYAVRRKSTPAEFLVE